MIKAASRGLLNVFPALTIFDLLKDHSVNLDKVAQDICCGRVEVTLVEFKQVDKKNSNTKFVQNKCLLSLGLIKEELRELEEEVEKIKG